MQITYEDYILIMPELPEVETIKRQLNEYLVGCVIVGVDVREKKVIHGNVEKLIGGRVEKVRRLGKGIIIEFDNGYSAAIHLKMTGQIIFKSGEVKDGVSEKKVGVLPGKHTHVIFKLKRQNLKGKIKGETACLFYNDIRKFGWVHVLKTDEIDKIPFFQNLGNDALGDLSEEGLFKILKSSRTAVKNTLMDQRKIAGIGNIYANDALFKAGIYPARKSNSLTRRDVKKLYESIIFVLEKGVREKGASDNNYVNALGGEGSYQKYFLVYKRDGEKCLRCGGVIRRFMLGGRATFVCMGCQNLSG